MGQLRFGRCPKIWTFNWGLPLYYPLCVRNLSCTGVPKPNKYHQICHAGTVNQMHFFHNDVFLILWIPSKFLGIIRQTWNLAGHVKPTDPPWKIMKYKSDASLLNNEMICLEKESNCDLDLNKRNIIQLKGLFPINSLALIEYLLSKTSS